MKKFKLGPNQLKWIEKLEKTKIPQTRHVLFDGKGYCCLGIACRVMGVKTRKKKDGSRYFEGENSVVPLSVKEKLKLRDIAGWPESPMFTSLVKLNDKEGFSFKKIAQVLREHPEQYFTGKA